MNDIQSSRRQFIRKSIVSSAFIASGPAISVGKEKESLAEIVNPGGRVPISFIIDDSTALVNMAYYGIPQFREVFPDRYPQDWKSLPREIPDDFVREFRDWCGMQGVKGKYSMVPYPACTGWLHRFVPGWSKADLEASLKLVRDTMTQNWDIHPEMISHTRVVNTRTGLPYPYATPEYMENWEWSQNKSADELGEYIAYALRVLHEAGFKCEGVTTPGGFGSRNMDNLAMGTLEAQRAVYQTQIPHFFRNVITEAGKSVAPEIFHASGLDTDDPRCVVHIIGCTGDWFGGWDGLTPGDADKFITPDLGGGRMVEVINSGEPAIMVCHWPGIYYNGEKIGFNVLKEVVKRLNEKYDHLKWMTLSEISRYWAARHLTVVDVIGDKIIMKAPFACPDFTLGLNRRIKSAVFNGDDVSETMEKKNNVRELREWTFFSNQRESYVCIKLPKGKSEIILQ